MFGLDFLPESQTPTKNLNKNSIHYGFFTVLAPTARFANEHTGKWYLIVGTNSKKKPVNKIGVQPFLYNDIRKYNTVLVNKKRNIFQISGDRVWRDTQYDSDKEIIQAFVESEVGPSQMSLYYCYERETSFREMELPLFQ